MDYVARTSDCEIPVILEPSECRGYPVSMWSWKLKHLGYSLSMIAIDAFVPILEKHRAKVESVERKTFKYGSTDRNQVRPKFSVSLGM